MRGLVVVAAVATCPMVALGQFAGGMGPGGMPMEAKPIHKSAKALECAVCKQATEELWQQVEDASGKLHEDDLQDMATALCDPDSEEGEWILFYDVTQAEAGAPLKLDRQEYLGECRRECRTIAKACRAVYDEYREDVAEALYKKSVSSPEKLKSRLCNKWAQVCPAKPLPKYQHPDEWWMPVDEEMYKMKKMQQMINKQAEKYGKQPVQFVDPMQSAMFMDEDDEL